MSRPIRMFEIIQILRQARVPMTAQAIADQLEVSKRTAYRDIAALQAMRVPIDGAAGIGYILRSGFDLPPINFGSEEIEAIIVGLALLRRTGDAGLQRAAERVANKIRAVLHEPQEVAFDGPSLQVSAWSPIPPSMVDVSALRRAIREERKVSLVYQDADGVHSTRTVLPIAIVYYIGSIVLAAWCELRGDFRHFRIDRILAVTPTAAQFVGQGDSLRNEWRESEDGRQAP